MPAQARLWHRLRSELGLIEHFRRYLRSELGVAAENLCILDTLPIPVATATARAGKGRGFNLAEGGYCASKRLHCLGFKLGRVITPQGIPDGYKLFGARHMDVEFVGELLGDAHDIVALGDKGFISKRWRSFCANSNVSV